MMNTKIIGVLGGGSWATAIIKLLLGSKPDEKINWFIRNVENIKYIKEHERNKHYLSSIKLNTKNLFISSDINSIINSSELLIIAIPSAFIKDSFTENKQKLSDKLIFSAVKGIIPDDNQIIAEFFNKKYKVPVQNIGVITGPCHAEEIAMERLSYLTVASENSELATYLAGRLNVHYTITAVSDDIYGTEYSSVLKNIFAIASGICNGLAYGDNFQAVLVSNAIREIKRFVDKIHPIKRDIKSSAYLGDLLVTSYSKFSRNRIFGNMIGKGYSVESAQIEMNMIAEGYYSVKSIYEIKSEYRINMPITDAVYNILYLKKPPISEMNILTKQLN